MAVRVRNLIKAILIFGVAFGVFIALYISYIYDALGTKLSKTISTTSMVIYYAGNYQYENSSLKFFGHPEGYIEPNGSNWEYFYQYTDHLGNIRLSYKDVNRNNGSASSLPPAGASMRNGYR